MFDHDESPKDWEMKDEEPPEKLRKKWEKEETAIPRTVICPSCKKETSAGNLTCLFCGAEILRESCPCLCFLSWIKQLFKKD